jgi:hypothetical protein
MRLIDRLVQGIDEELRGRTCVVFDAANPPQDRPSEFQSGGVEVKFAVGHPEADDLLEELISANSSPKTLAVISSDHRVQMAATRRGCTIYDSQPWLDAFLDGVVGLAGGRRRSGGSRQGEPGQGRGVAAKPGSPGQVDDREVDRWLREFGF